MLDRRRMQLPFEVDYRLCTGCMACVSACPKDAIEIHVDEEGFQTPCCDMSKCISCGGCKKSCPIISGSNLEKHFIKDAICKIVRLKDENNLLNSASGGAFYGVAHYVLSNDGVVYGVAYTNAFQVKHIRITDINDLSRLQNSKYVQSDIGLIYRSVLRDLIKKKNVLFSGTPCQIAGLKLFLKKDYENLITIEIICHGVPSPSLLKMEMDSKVRKYGEVKKIQFRQKGRYTRSNFFLTFAFKNNKVKMFDKKHDLYYYLFLSGVAFRESCYSCHFASPYRVADITIGDVDSFESYMDFFPNSSNSSLLVHTQKATRLWNECKNEFDYINLDILKEAHKNKQLVSPPVRPIVRDVIYKDISRCGYQKIYYLYCEEFSLIDKLKLFLLANFPRVVINACRCAINKICRKI